MKIFVTGMTGFIGSRLPKFLSASDEIYALVRPGSKGLPDGTKVRTVRGDLSAPSAIFDELKRIRPDACIHLAWEGIPDFSYDMSQRNLDQSTQLVRCLVEECECRKLVLAGSCVEYGKPFGPCREVDPITITSYFTWVKHALCDLGMFLAEKYPVSFVWPRFFYVYGPGQRSGSLVPSIALMLLRGEPLSVKMPLNANDFIYVDDIAEVLALAAHKDIPTGIYNFGTGKSVPVWKVCEVLEKAMGRESVCAGELKNSLDQATVDFWADTQQSEKVLGWRGHTDIEQGIGLYLKSLKEETV